MENTAILNNLNVEWVVDDNAEIGVKIGDQFFFMYKGCSYSGGTKWRYVNKREFGCHLWDTIKKQCGSYSLPRTYIGFLGEAESEWNDLPR